MEVINGVLSRIVFKSLAFSPVQHLVFSFMDVLTSINSLQTPLETLRDLVSKGLDENFKDLSRNLSLFLTQMEAKTIKMTPNSYEAVASINLLLV